MFPYIVCFTMLVYFEQALNVRGEGERSIYVNILRCQGATTTNKTNFLPSYDTDEYSGCSLRLPVRL